MISSHCRQLQYVRKIILVTNGEGAMDASDLDNITSKAKSDGIDIVILSVAAEISRLLCLLTVIVGASTLTMLSTASKRRTRILTRHVFHIFSAKSSNQGRLRMSNYSNHLRMIAAGLLVHLHKPLRK